MRKRVLAALIMAAVANALPAAAPAAPVSRTFPAASGGTLVLDLDAGGDVEVAGTGGSSVKVAYTADCTPQCSVEFEETPKGLRVETRFSGGGGNQNSDIVLKIQVPGRFDVQVSSMGGDVSINGVEGEFSGKTHGGALTLRGVRGSASLSTMGGEITLTDSELDGSLKTMGGEVLFENVVGDVRGSSMGGNVRYKNVRRRDGEPGRPPRTEEVAGATPETVQISTMGGRIEVEEAPEGANLQTMGGDIRVSDARRFVRATTMGGDIVIDGIDGWVDATTMGGSIETTVTGSGGDVTLTSMSGDITLHVPPGFGMDLDLEIAFTRNSEKNYTIKGPGRLPVTTTPEWDHTQGSPRRYIRSTGAVDGGGNKVKIRTVNGNITVVQGS